MPRDVAQDLVKEKSNLTLVEIPDSGHFIPLEQPAAFEAPARKWLPQKN